MGEDFISGDPFSEEEFNDFSSSSELVSHKNQMTSIFTEKLVKYLGLSQKNTLENFINSLKKLKTGKNSSKVLLKNIIPKRAITDTLDEIPTLIKQDGTTKELFITFLLMLLGSIEEKSGERAIQYLNEYVDKSNIVVGYGKTHGRRWGFDFLTLKMNLEKNMISSISFGELKYRYNLDTVMSRNQLPFSKNRKKKLKSLMNMSKIGPYLIFNGALEYLPDTSFSYNSTYNRGNDLIVKMKSWEKHIHKIISNDNLNDMNKKILTKKLTGGKAFHLALKDAILEQAYLEALCENGMIFDEKGEIKTNHNFSFIENNFKITIKSEDFEMCKMCSYDETGRYVTFNLINKIRDNFPEILKANKDKYKIYIADNTKNTLKINRKNLKIVTSADYYKLNKQKLIAEIKTRFINDIRDFKLLSQWKNIIEKDAEVRSDLIFVTSSPNIDSKKERWKIWKSLRRGKEENLLFGPDRVFQFALKPQAKNKSVLRSNWFLELDELLEGNEISIGNQIKKQKKSKNKTPKRDDLFKNYRNLRNEWHKSGYPNISTDIRLNPENLFGSGFNNDLSITDEWVKLRRGEEYRVGNKIVRIKSYFVEPDSFYSSYLDFHVVLIQKDSSRGEIIFDEFYKKPRIISKITIPKRYANLFPHPSDKVRNGKKNTYFRRGYIDKKTLDKTYQTLMNSKFLDKGDKQIIENLNEKWVSKLSKKGKVEILFNSIEATILLLETLRIMNYLTKAFFKILKSNTKFLSSSNSRRDFSKNYSFGLIAESSIEHNKYVVYEILSDKLLNFAKLVETRLGLMIKHYKEFKWTKQITRIRKTLNQLLRKYST